MTQGPQPSAFAWYRGAVIVRPASINAHNHLACALSDKGDLDAAIAEFHEVLKLDSKYADAHNNLGNALRNKGKFDEAVAEFLLAIKFEPDNAFFHSNLGYVLYRQGKVDEAIAECQHALELDRRHAPAYNTLGIVLYDQNEFDEAIAKCQEAIKLDPMYAFAYNNLGNALGAKGDLGRAITAFQMALRIAPQHPVLANNLRRTERWRDLLPRLADFAAGRGEAPAPAAACEMGLLAAQPFQRRYALATRLFSTAFAANPTLADDLATDHRYNAACCAVLAGCGEGYDAPTNPTACAALRAKAVVWLRTTTPCTPVNWKVASPPTLPRCSKKCFVGRGTGTWAASATRLPWPNSRRTSRKRIPSSGPT